MILLIESEVNQKLWTKKSVHPSALLLNVALQLLITATTSIDYGGGRMAGGEGMVWPIDQKFLSRTLPFAYNKAMHPNYSHTFVVLLHTKITIWLVQEGETPLHEAIPICPALSLPANSRYFFGKYDSFWDP